MKSLMRQLIEAKLTNNEDAYEYAYEEISMSLETLCNSFTKDDVTKETMIELYEFMKKYTETLKEYADDL
jgi:DNA-directed RNA polymerase specialized sigma24 family protein